MKIYFPQWQGAGNGEHIEAGALTILNYLKDPDFMEIPLSTIPSGIVDNPTFQINNYGAISEQLKRFKVLLENEKPEKLFTIGGDCGLEIVPVSYLNSRYSNLGVIWFDAHADINRPCDSPSCNFHGMPLRTLLGEGEPTLSSLLFSTIVPEQIHYVGLRDIDEAEKICLEYGNIYHPRRLNLSELVALLKSKDILQLYLHFDFDCLEPNEYDKTYYKVPQGLRIKEAESSIKELHKHFEVVGTSVLESIALSQEELIPIRGILNLLMT